MDFLVKCGHHFIYIFEKDMKLNMRSGSAQFSLKSESNRSICNNLKSVKQEWSGIAKRR